ncbi:coiled-coil domain-containing protein [Amycolatopsis aidingensis]|uniref:hypothetical protein n=1 Tax=Amycolatopsis aidingensis TaxID=2842453 RepID=UPI001C0ACA73|nr:hypothetical protein [Amycolatopsis aidingensis]
MYELSKVRLYSVGPAGARYENVLLDLSGVGAAVRDQQLVLGGQEIRRPSPASILFLENGGGKSVLMKLIFSVVLPGRREVVGTSNTKVLEKFVGRDDVAHVVLEWTHTRTGRLLITGKVSQWRDRSPQQGEEKLADLWYSLRPGTTVDVASLPFAEDGQNLTAADFRARLDDLYRTDPALELQWAGKHRDWSAQLDELGLDPELFRYQRVMNTGEGEAADAFTFTTDENFVDFLLKAALPAGDSDDLADSIAGHAEKLAARQGLELEHTFVEELLELLAQLAEQRTVAEEARKAADTAAGNLRGFVSRLGARVDHENALLETRVQHIGELTGAVSQASAHLDQAQKIGAALAHRTANLWLSAALSTEKAAQSAEEEAQQILQGWAATRKLQDHEVAAESAATLRNLVSERQDAARVALNKRDAKSRDLARSLLSTVDGATAEAEELDVAVGKLENSVKATTSEWKSAVDGAAQATALATQLDGRAAAVDGEVEAAVRDGLISSVAALADDAQALAGRVRSDANAIKEGEGRLAELDAQVDEARGDLLESQKDLIAAKGQVEEARSAMRRAEAAAAALSREPRLGELLDTGDVILEYDTETLLDQLAKAQADVDRRRTGLRVADAADEPARVVWDDDPEALLPPHHEVDRARQLLEDAGITSVAGWTYLAERSDESIRAELVRRLPHLAGGVLINKPELLERAQEVLAENGYHPTGTVVVATTQSFDVVVEAKFDLSFRSDTGFVAAPNPALFDHEAADAERLRIAGKHAERRSRLAELDTAYGADRALSARLIAWRAEYPPGTMGELADAVASAEALLEQAGQTATRDEEALKLVIKTRNELKEQLGGMHRALEKLTEQSRRLTELLGRSREAASWRLDAGRARETADTYEARAATLEQILEKLREDIQANRLLAADRRAVAVRAQSEIGELPGGSTADRADPVPEHPVAVLRAILADAQRAYGKAEVGDDQLKDLQHAETKANDTRQAWEAEPADIREIARRLLASIDGPDAASRAAAIAAAGARLETAKKTYQDAISETANCRARLEQLPKPTVTLDQVRQPRDAQHGDQLVAEAGRAVSDAEETHRQCAAKLEAAKGELTKAEATAEAFRHLIEMHHAASDDEPGVDTTDVEPFTGDKEAAHNRYNELRRTAAQALKDSQAAQRELLRRAERVTTCAMDSRFEALAIPARTQIQGVAVSALAEHAADWARQLRPRLRSLADDLAQIGRHRAAILERLSAIVDGALRRLRTAQRLSRLPDGLGDWTGSEFLRIGCSPVDGDLLAHQLGLVLDGAVEHHAKSNKCDGLAVVLRAVRAAVPKGFTVTMLKPDAVLRTERVRISEVRDVFSGGQHLTAAIILYCTLAALRANDQGKVRRHHSHSGVLFLDNPIGRASAGYLLDLQRGVATALGVQLVYTTGLFEEEALAGFPLIIRLRNDADLRAGRKYLSVHERIVPHLDSLPQPTDTGALTATRITLPKRRHDEAN